MHLYQFCHSLRHSNELHCIGVRTIFTKADIMHLKKKCLLRFGLNVCHITSQHSARFGRDPGAGVFAFLI